MVGTDKAENVFGQVLICLRMSKLDFLIKETPYSAYITIRKKFVKSVIGNEEILEIDNVKVIDNQHDKLKETLKSLETRYGMLEFEHEELEMKYEQTKRDYSALEDTIEEAYEESRNLKKNLKELEAEKSDIKSKLKEEIDKDRQNDRRVEIFCGKKM